jgi:hypothetical protein
MVRAMAKQPIDPAITAAATAEIARQVVDYTQRRRKVTEELASLFAARQAGQNVDVVPPADVVAARERAAEMLNGTAPAFLKTPVAITREAQLTIERDAIDLVLNIFQREELRANAAEATQWLEQHGAEWRALCAEIVLTALRLRALEKRAVNMRASIGSIAPAALPMSADIGVSGSFLNINGVWGAEPLSRPREAALAAKIITAQQVRDIERIADV